MVYHSSTFFTQCKDIRLTFDSKEQQCIFNIPVPWTTGQSKEPNKLRTSLSHLHWQEQKLQPAEGITKIFTQWRPKPAFFITPRGISWGRRLSKYLPWLSNENRCAACLLTVFGFHIEGDRSCSIFGTLAFDWPYRRQLFDWYINEFAAAGYKTMARKARILACFSPTPTTALHPHTNHESWFSRMNRNYRQRDSRGHVLWLRNRRKSRIESRFLSTHVAGLAEMADVRSDSKYGESNSSKSSDVINLVRATIGERARFWNGAAMRHPRRR